MICHRTSQAENRSQRDIQAHSYLMGGIRLTDYKEIAFERHEAIRECIFPRKQAAARCARRRCVESRLKPHDRPKSVSLDMFHRSRRQALRTAYAYHVNPAQRDASWVSRGDRKDCFQPPPVRHDYYSHFILSAAGQGFEPVLETSLTCHFSSDEMRS